MPFSVFVNPRIEVINPEQQGYWEGCLSVPGLRGKVYRPQHIALEYLDHNGDAQQMELQGFLATVFQHEFDHLDGILFPDRVADPRHMVTATELARRDQWPDGWPSPGARDAPIRVVRSAQ